MITCDCCNEDLTPGSSLCEDEEIYRHIIKLNGKKVCLCDDCYEVISDWACSDEHREAVKKYKEQFPQQEYAIKHMPSSI